MILGQSSVEGISSNRVIELDLISVKGKKEPERIYTVLGEDIEIEDEKVFFDEHSKFVEMYRKQDWVSAREHIKKYVKDVPSFDLYYELISNRIEEYIENPPPNDWEGVFVAKTK